MGSGNKEKRSKETKRAREQESKFILQKELFNCPESWQSNCHLRCLIQTAPLTCSDLQDCQSDRTLEKHLIWSFFSLSP